jgi:hypothetical protein
MGKKNGSKGVQIHETQDISRVNNAGLYYKNILTIVNEACTINVLQFSLIALASVINYDHKWHYNLEHHILMTLAVSITIVICL